VLRDDDEVAAIGQTAEELKEASERADRTQGLQADVVTLGLTQVVSSGVVEVAFGLDIEELNSRPFELAFRAGLPRPARPRATDDSTSIGSSQSGQVCRGYSRRRRIV